jgi:serine/threonine protein kinase
MIDKLGKFEILGRLGPGAMGVVYKARVPFIDRIVALKTLTTGFVEDPHHLKRFYSEARSAGNLRHPNIVTIYELGHEGDTPFIARQFVVDFGIARLGDSTVSQSKGLLIGTLGYMSPQLFRGAAADARSDIWATGVMFYELLAYRRPFKGENAAALMSNIILEDHRSVQEIAPGTPDDVRSN